jgi:hypothetical protein
MNNIPEVKRLNPYAHAVLVQRAKEVTRDVIPVIREAERTRKGSSLF